MESANDHKAHAKTYDGFIGKLKWSIPLLAVITAVVVFLISN
ncbi:aa3-type cytochrome c oxidase subunit IV [Qipengyuania marisflavi]|uniref:Aa3-type cytochrome c oxidase subunit IV n=1 Tax=Qipengyuania marisflavi TaxID=2486356 RepID=A0A5S3PCB7_9SPHN|nr:aa3-type cytochrome c oxidase subunit IV [Qipengyuania marisflavi]TMM48889.1 aa3-type cytochrome c oxidase subunit IV [Qipengyuania marisflavi]